MPPKDLALCAESPDTPQPEFQSRGSSSAKRIRASARTKGRSGLKEAPGLVHYFRLTDEIVRKTGRSGYLYWESRAATER